MEPVKIEENSGALLAYLSNFKANVQRSIHFSNHFQIIPNTISIAQFLTQIILLFLSFTHKDQFLLIKQYSYGSDQIMKIHTREYSIKKYGK